MRRWSWIGLALAGAIAAAGCEGTPAGTGGDPSVSPLTGDGGVTCAHPSEGCACDQAIPIDCYLDATIQEDGTLMCNRGTRYCRDGYWTGCESVTSYELRSGPGIAPIIEGPSECNPCDPACAYSTDRPEGPGDVTSTNSSGVEYDSSPGGVEIIPDLTTVTGSLPDTDGDGVPDVADDCVGAGAYMRSDGTCAEHLDGFYYHTLPYGGPAETDPLTITAQVRTADVYFLMDTTGSMGGEISNLQAGLTSGSYSLDCDSDGTAETVSGGIIGAIRCMIPDAWFGVGRFDDYPVSPYGGSIDEVYGNLQDLTGDIAAAQTAVNALSLHWGYDGPESNTQALWAAATGGSIRPFLSARTGCGTDTWGWPCFREGTIPIIVQFTDAPFHQGYTGYDYDPATLCGGSASCEAPKDWPTVVSALSARSIRVITVHSCDGASWCHPYGLNDSTALANATGSTNSSGSPYVFPISSNGTGLSSAVVNAIVDLANYNRMDISARATDDVTTTAVDERGFVQAITPTTWTSGSCTGISGNTFLQCLPGTDVAFDITFRNDFVMPTTVPQVFEFFIEVVGDGAFVMERIPVRIVVPAEVPTYPPTGSYWRDHDSTTRCAENERPDWGDLSWVASTPSDTSIRFELRTADALTDLPAATPVSFTVPGTASPADVGARLIAAGQSNYRPYLRVTAVLLSSSDRTESPTLTSMELMFTCTPTE